MVIIISALPQIIAPQSPIMIIILASLRISLMLSGNTSKRTVSNIIWTVMTTTAALIVASTRTGIATFPPLDA